MCDIKYDCIIIGGGVSGVTFAHYLHQQGKKTLIIEKEERLGGQVQSEIATNTLDYWRELGAHTCYNSYTHLLDIVKDINCSNLIEPLGRASYVTYSERKIKKMLSGLSIFPLFTNGLKLFLTKKEGKTVKEYFGNIVGRKNYNNLFTYLFRAVLSQNADEYPAELFLKKRSGRDENFPRKYSFTKGLSSFIDSIVDKDRLNIEQTCEVIDVQLEKEGDELTYKVITLGDKTYYAANIAFATDPHTTARLVKDLEPQLAKLLASISLFRSESLNIVVPKEKLSLAPVAGIIPLSDLFLSAVSRDLVESDNLRSFTFHFEDGMKNKEEKMDIICEVLNIQAEDIQEQKLASHILPSLRMEHLNMAEQVAELACQENMYLLGNYYYGLSLEDCIHRSSDEAQRFKKNL